MQVVNGVSLEVHAGELVGLLGRNGAGKTTLLMAIAGVRKGAGSGSVEVLGREVARMRPHEVVASGLALVPEGRRIFREMSVEENLEIGAFARRKERASVLGEDLDMVYELFPVLSLYRRRLAGELSGGEQQMVAVGQALMARPEVLVLDEPAAGLSPAVASELYERVRELVAGGLGVLVVEQVVERALSYVERLYVMEQGSVILHGSASELEEETLTSLIVRGAGPGAAAGRTQQV
jgi:branched-chain amino acid transport system ATP-binding protein